MRVYEKYSMRVSVLRQIQHSTSPCAVLASRHPPSAVFFIHTSVGGALTVTLYFLVVWLRATFLIGQIAAIFAHQDVSECLWDPCLAVGRSSWASFSKKLWCTHDQLCCSSEVKFKQCVFSVMRRSTSVYTIYF